jgi:hypothetical protein
MDPWTKDVAIFTALLALATFVLAWATWRMARISRRSLALDSRPYLAYDGLKCWKGAPNALELVPALILKNAGRVLLHYHVDRIEITANGRLPSDPAIRHQDGVLAPGISVEFVGPHIAQVDLNQYFQGHAQFRITYWSDSKGERYLAEQEVGFEGNESRQWQRSWTVGVPNYT